MTFVLLLLATWLVLNVALLGAAAGLGRRRTADQESTSGSTSSGTVVPFGAR